jgi:hypothetical protein
MAATRVSPVATTTVSRRTPHDSGQLRWAFPVSVGIVSSQSADRCRAAAGVGAAPQGSLSAARAARPARITVLVLWLRLHPDPASETLPIVIPPPQALKCAQRPTAEGESRVRAIVIIADQANLAEDTSRHVRIGGQQMLPASCPARIPWHDARRSESRSRGTAARAGARRSSRPPTRSLPPVQAEAATGSHQTPTTSPATASCFTSSRTARAGRSPCAPAI